MTTCADLIDETRRLLFSGQRERMNRLTSDITAADTSITFDFELSSMAEGSYIAVDLEIMYVWSVTASSKTATVQRAMLGSTAATHTSGSLVYVNSKFPAYSIFTALNEDLDDLSAPDNGLFQVVSKELTYNPAVQGYDLGVAAGVNVLDVLSVTADVPGPSQDWVPLTSWRLATNTNTTDFSSGTSITLLEGGSPGLTVRVLYSTPFTKFAALTDNVTTTGLPTSAYDLPPLGAALRLVGVREIKRNFDESQGDTRRASEVPPNAQLAGYQAVLRERSRRVKAESNRLATNWPMRRKFPR